MPDGTGGPERLACSGVHRKRGREMLTDEEILGSLRRSPERFTVLFDRYFDPLTAFFASRVQDQAAAADLCAETLAAVLVAAPTFDPSHGSARQWVFGIARHKLYDYWRELRVSQEALTRCGVDLAAVAYDDLDRIDVQTDRSALWQALRRLPTDLRDAVRLRVVDELPYDDIAASLGIRAGTARVRVHRGLRRLRIDLESRWADGR